MSEYVYFVTGLPDITLDEGKTFPLSLDFFDEISDRLDEPDRKLLRYVRYPMDNRNLIRALEGKEGGFDPRGNFTKEEIDNLIRGTESGPDYIDFFLQARRESRILFTGLNNEDTLNTLFLDEMESHSNSFIREWFAFDADIRNLLAGFNVRSLGRELSKVVVGRGYVADAILKSSSPDFGLMSTHPWVEKLVHETVLQKRDKAADLIRWDKLDEFRTVAHFHVEALLAYALQLYIAERWLVLDAVEGRKMLERLSGHLVSGLNQFMPAFR